MKSWPGIPRTNARAERVNRDVLDGTRTLLIHAVLPGSFWPFAANHYCHMHNVRKNADGTSPWTLTHGDDFVGPEIPFGAAVIFVPAETQNSGHLHNWGPTGRLGVFAGYDLQPGSTWTGGGSCLGSCRV